MKKQSHPLLFTILLIVTVSLACQALATSEAPTSTPNPTLPPAATATTVSTIVPIPTRSEPTPKPVKDFFKEEFEDEVFFDDWFYFIVGPASEDNLDMNQEGDGVTIDLGELDMYMYYIYEPKTYTDVKATMVAENLGRNNNNVSMVCRLDYDSGKWYEFSVESGGLWYLYAFDNGYNFLDSGGASALKQGKEINEYGLECNGNTLTMYINGNKLKTYTDKKYNFKEGNVGFNISSLNVLPIKVNIKSFDISKP